MVNDKPNDHIVCWNDQGSEEWQATGGNDAGSWISPYALTGPAVIAERGTINIPTSYGIWEMRFQGQPWIYGFYFKAVIKQPMEIVA